MQKDKKGFGQLMEWAGKDRVYIYLSICSSLIASLVNIVPYYVLVKISNEVINRTVTIETAVHYAIIILVAAGFKTIFSTSSTLFSHKGAYNTLFKVRCMVTDHMAKLPLGALNDRSTGEIKCVMNESIEKLELFLAHNLTELVLYLSGPVVIFIYFMTVHAGLALVSLIPLLIVAVVMIIMFARFGKFMDEINASVGELSGGVSEYVNGMRLIKAYGMSSESFDKYASGIKRQFKLWCDVAKATGPLYAIYVVMLECGAIFLVPYGGYLYINGKISASVLLLFAFVGSQYLTDIRPLQELSTNLSYALNGVDQVKKILDLPVFEGDKHFPEKHDIKLTNVSFAYQDEMPVLKNVNLHIKEGERVAFVGHSGAGKSTLVQLISRFYDVTSGKIEIGGVDVRDIAYEELLQNVSVVFQQSFLTKESVYENIAMGDSTATLEKVREAAKKAQIDDFIMSLPDGYDTLVGSYGTRFSGGQKQRICIARAMLKNSPILIMDEATSAADPENQFEIDKAIENLCMGKTVIIVAHRLEIVERCDRIAAVVDHGLEAVGSFEEELAKSPYFAKAWETYVTARNMEYRLKGDEA